MMSYTVNWRTNINNHTRVNTFFWHPWVLDTDVRGGAQIYKQNTHILMFYFTCMGICLHVCLCTVCVLCLQRLEESSGPMELALQTIVCS